MRRLCYCTVVVALQAKIQEHLEDNAEIEQGLVLSIYFVSYCQLHITVDTENPQRLNDKIDQDEEENILNEEAAQEYRVSDQTKGTILRNRAVFARFRY